MKLYPGNQVTFFPKSGRPRNGIVVRTGIEKGKVEVLLHGDPFPVVIPMFQIEKGHDVPVMARKRSPARELRQDAKALGIKGWEDMDLPTMKAAVAAASEEETPKPAKTRVPAGRKVPVAQAEKTARKIAAQKKQATGNRPARKGPSGRARAAAKPAKKSAPKKTASKRTKTGVNPFRPGSNVHRVTEELLKGGKRIDIAKRLRKHVALHPWSKDKEEDPIAAIDKRLLLTAGLLEREHGFKEERNGRGISGTIKVIPPGAAKRNGSRKVVAKKKAKR